MAFKKKSASRKKLFRFIVLAAVVGGGYFLYEMVKLPTFPERKPVTNVVWLNQGWSRELADDLHHRAQGTLLLPFAWLREMNAGPLTSKKLGDPEILGGLGFIPDAKNGSNAEGLPIGLTVSSWAQPGVPGAPELRKVGLTCAGCHTGMLTYNGTGILIEGGGSMIDAGTMQEIIGKAVGATAYLPWLRSAFVDTIVSKYGERREVVEAMLSAAGRNVIAAFKASPPWAPLYEAELHGRLDALQRIANTLLADDLREPENNKHGDGPVKFPYLWDIWRLDWVQYNASVRQPMMRNIGEALGVRAETAFLDPDGYTNPAPTRWETSVNIENLKWIEETLRQLQPPEWPPEIFDKGRNASEINNLRSTGGALFREHCRRCHQIQVKFTGSPLQAYEWIVTPVPVEQIGTDPKAADNFIAGQYLTGKFGIGDDTGQLVKKLSAGDGLRVVTTAIEKAYYEKNRFSPAKQADWNGFGRSGDVRAERIYKARPLVGVWASPPYLHNGSVPTLHDLLSPTRPKEFLVGDREYDPVKVGYRTDGIVNGQKFDTTRRGNSNAGHWFTNDMNRPGRIGPELTESQRGAIIEYLKRATYRDYPCIDFETRADLQGEVCGWKPEPR